MGAMAAVALALGAGCSGDDDTSPAAPASPTTPTSGADGPGPTEPLDDACGHPAPTTWEMTGTIHTVVPGDQPVETDVELDPDTVCPGGQVRLRLTIRNTGGGDAVVDSPRVILSGGIDKWVIAERDALRIEADATETIDEVVTIPLVPPGDYTVGLYGYELGGRLTVADPAA